MITLKVTFLKAKHTFKNVNFSLVIHCSTFFLRNKPHHCINIIYTKVAVYSVIKTLTSKKKKNKTKKKQKKQKNTLALPTLKMLIFI